MYTAIVFLPLLGSLIAGAIVLFGHKLPVGDVFAHGGHGHDDHSHDDGHGIADAHAHATGHAHDEPAGDHDDHAHHHDDPAGTKLAQYITTALLFVAAILSWIAFVRIGVLEGGAVHVPLFTWIQSGQLNVSWSLRVDTLTVVMLVVVTTVSSLVHLYSIGYMSHDEHKTRFFAYLSFFTFAMLTLVTSDNLLQMFFGWEGVGVASYLLIGFWFKRPTANAAAIKAFVVNRVGDFGFALGIFGVFVLFNSIDLSTIFAGAAGLKGKDIFFLGHHFDALTCVTLLLFMGAMGKSAQFLLHTWLPDAMEGPTPVSALIHAATMVTAGVFMVARLSPLFDNAPDTLAFVTFIGATTAFFAATVGLVQTDIKRVIAYSTCSQLGYMFAALGVGDYSAGVFHLFTHAFFKALLFLCAGSVIHAVSGEQDMRLMGGLRAKIPLTFWMMIAGTLAITGVGIPLTEIGFAGFNSKDAIIEATYMAPTFFAPYAFFMLSVAALFTSFYSWRLIFLTFFGKTRASDDVIAHVHESPLVMTIPLMVLAVGAVLAGMVFSGLFMGEGHEAAHIVESWGAFWQGAIYVNPDNKILTEAHHVPVLVSFIPFLAMAIGLATAYQFYIRRPDLPGRLAAFLPDVYQFLLNKWYFDELYDLIFVRPAKWIGRVLWKGGDGVIIDGYGPDGVSARVIDITARVVKLQTGYVYHYAFVMLIGVAFLVTWMLTGGTH